MLLKFFRACTVTWGSSRFWVLQRVWGSCADVCLEFRLDEVKHSADWDLHGLRVHELNR